jgi:hypothetical protein
MGDLTTLSIGSNWPNTRNDFARELGNHEIDETAPL